MIDSETRFFVGVVTSSDSATYNIQVEARGTSRSAVIQGIPLATVFATSLGFKECPQYPVGAVVLCYHVSTEMCYIMGIIPPHDYANQRAYSRACLKTSDGNFDAQNTVGYNDKASKMATHNQNRPTDVVEGEFVMANEFGVLLGLFQEMAMLKASELAQIQCYLLDDLVRIISHNYEHFTALGEFKITHDGKAIIAEFGATHLSQESMGISQSGGTKNTPVFSETGKVTVNDVSDYYTFTQDERIKAIERLKIFVGRLGDFLHLFIVRPDADAIRTLSGASNDKFDRGMFDVHLSQDGRLSVRTVTGIAIEKTNWIMVPQRVCTPEDPKGDLEGDITFDNKDPFIFDDSHTYRNNPTLYFLQLRDCNAYLQDLYNYKNFLKYTKDFQLSADPQNKETSLEQITQVDPYTPVKFSNYTLRRSGFYLLDNGGVMIKDAWGSATVWEGGNIYHQPAKDYIVQPLRNCIVKAGQFVSIAAKNDVDVSSSTAGFRLKTKNVQHFYSSDQGIILQSDSKLTAVPSPTDQAYDTFGGVLIKAKTGIYQYADNIFDRANKIGLYKADKNTFQSVNQPLIFQSKQDITFITGGDLNLFSKNSVNVVGEQSVQVVGNNTNIGKKGTIIGMVPDPNSPFPTIMDGVIDLSIYTKIIDTYSSNDPQQLMAPFDTDSAFTTITFRFLSSDKYNLTSQSDCIPMTIAQQDDATFGLLGLGVWKEPEISGTLPFPGKDKFSSYYVTAPLQNLQKINNDFYSKNSMSLQSTGAKLTDTSLQSYKVQQ